MKKVFLVSLIGLSIVQGASNPSALMGSAFPSNGFGSCAKEKGNLKFAIIKQIEGVEGGQTLVDKKVEKDIVPCVNGNNPNFKTNLLSACQLASSITDSPTKNKLCATTPSGGVAPGASVPGAPDNKALMAKTFPQNGWGACAKEKGNIDFISMAELEKTDAGKADVTKKVDSLMKECPFAKNANFSANVKAACKLAPAGFMSANMDKLCGTTSAVVIDPSAQQVVGTVVDPSTIPAATPVVQGIVIDTKALMAKAFPSGGWGACAKEKGNIDFASIVELEKTDAGKADVAKKVDSLMKQCPFAKNPNFSASMQVACQAASAITTSPSKDKLCGASPVNGNDPAALLKKAFPDPAFSMACSEGRGAVDFNALALVETSNPTALIAKQNETITCASGAKKNPKFI